MTHDLYYNTPSIEFQYDFHMDGCAYTIFLLNQETYRFFPREVVPSLVKSYGECFSRQTHILENLAFLSGCSFVIYRRDQGTAEFLIHLSPDYPRGNVVVYNICKNFSTKLDVPTVIGTILHTFIPDNTLFRACPRVILCMVNDNSYFFPAFKTYCKVGFRVTPQPHFIEHETRTYFTMEIPLHRILENRVIASEPHHEFLQLFTPHNKHVFNEIHLRDMYHAYRHRKPITWTTQSRHHSRDTHTESFTHHVVVDKPNYLGKIVKLLRKSYEKNR